MVAVRRARDPRTSLPHEPPRITRWADAESTAAARDFSV